MQQKDLKIETLRGLTIILVVAGHVIGSAPEGGMRIQYPHMFRYVYTWIDYIQMPLFTALAGWVYALYFMKYQNSFFSFVYNKFKRLIIPMACVGTLYFIIQYLMPGTNQKGNLSEIWRIYVYPYTLYWYLPSLFWIFIIQWLLDKYHIMDNYVKWIVVLIVCIAIHYAERYSIVISNPNLFSYRGALNQLPYFVLGVGLVRFKNELYTKCWGYISVLFSIIGILLVHIEWQYICIGEKFPRSCELLEIISLLMILYILLSRVRFVNKYLVFIGLYSYAIYLFHGFGTSGGRIILKSIGVQNEFIIFTFSLIISVFIPILIAKIGTRYKLFRIFFLGNK